MFTNNAQFWVLTKYNKAPAKQQIPLNIVIGTTAQQVLNSAFTQLGNTQPIFNINATGYIGTAYFGNTKCVQFTLVGYCNNTTAHYGLTVN